MSSVCYSHVRVCHAYVTRMYSHVIRMSLVCTLCHPYVTRITRMLSVCHSYVLLCHPYVTRMYSYVTVCHSYVHVCHPYVTLCGFTMNPSFPLIFISGSHRVTAVTMNKVFDLFGFFFHYLSFSFHCKIFLPVQNNNCTPSTLCILVTINLGYDIIWNSLLYQFHVFTQFIVMA